MATGGIIPTPVATSLLQHHRKKTAGKMHLPISFGDLQDITFAYLTLKSFISNTVMKRWGKWMCYVLFILSEHRVGFLKAPKLETCCFNTSVNTTYRCESHKYTTESDRYWNIFKVNALNNNVRCYREWVYNKCQVCRRWTTLSFYSMWKMQVPGIHVKMSEYL